MLKGCGHDVGGYVDTHWNFYCDVLDRILKAPEDQVIRPCHTGPVN
jgi:hypothetical protein